MSKPYQIVDDQWIRLTDGPYEGTVYKYGRVQLIEEQDQLRLKFEYELNDGTRLDEDFVQHIGPILVELIVEGVLKNNIVYTGGTDAT